jgi:ferric-dicitrate binding protein FerR (iron transport regulator)
LKIDNDHIDELIGKYLARETSAAENALLELWIAESEANRKYFGQLKTIFDRSTSAKEWQHFDTDAAWSKVRSKLNEKNGKSIALNTSKYSFNSFLRIAASIIIVLGVGFFTYRMLQPSPPSKMDVITEKRTEADTLPDGTGVFLNKETKLSYSFDKKKKTHLVRLKGEAYFNINHEDDKTFIVEVDDIIIKDIGTSFNVKAYPESNTIEVVVEKGAVMFYSDNNTGVYLREGGKGVYSRSSKTFTVEEAEQNVTAYKTKFFIFTDTDLAAAVQSINSVYDKKIVIGNNLKNCHLTVTFNNENIEEIASVIAETLGLKVKSSDKEIVLEGKGCE